MGRPRVVVLSRQGSESLTAEHRDLLAQRAQVAYVVQHSVPGPERAARLLAGADVLAATNVAMPVLDEPLLDGLPRLRAVVLYATGHDHVDVDLLSRRDVTLSVLPDYATGAVAEHALAMLMSLAARVHLANDRSRGLADSETSLRGVELGGRTLAILGLGRIGRRLATLAAGIGMRVVGADVDHAARVRAAATGVAVTELDTALARADAVAVTASHRFEGPALLGPAELHAMRRGALLVNVGRRALVDTAAACAMLRAGRLRGYAVDDVVVDPAAAADLVEQGRLLQTGHSAWWRDEVLERGRLKWGEALLDAVQGKPRDVVTAPAGAQEGQATAAAGAGM